MVMAAPLLEGICGNQLVRAFRSPQPVEVVGGPVVSPLIS